MCCTNSTRKIILILVPKAPCKIGQGCPHRTTRARHDASHTQLNILSTTLASTMQEAQSKYMHSKHRTHICLIRGQKVEQVGQFLWPSFAAFAPVSIALSTNRPCKEFSQPWSNNTNNFTGLLKSLKSTLSRTGFSKLLTNKHPSSKGTDVVKNNGHPSAFFPTGTGKKWKHLSLTLPPHSEPKGLQPSHPCKHRKWKKN